MEITPEFIFVFRKPFRNPVEIMPKSVSYYFVIEGGGIHFYFLIQYQKICLILSKIKRRIMPVEVFEN